MRSSVGKESAWKAGDSSSIPGSGRSPGKEMATHSSIHAWRIQWTEEPGGQQFIGSQRVGHDWATKAPPVWWEACTPPWRAARLPQLEKTHSRNKDLGPPRMKINPGLRGPESQLSISQLGLFYQLILAGPLTYSTQIHIDSYQQRSCSFETRQDPVGLLGTQPFCVPLTTGCLMSCPPTPAP